MRDKGQFITLRRQQHVLLVGLHSSSKSLNLMRVTEVGFDIGLLMWYADVYAYYCIMVGGGGGGQETL